MYNVDSEVKMRTRNSLSKTFVDLPRCMSRVISPTVCELMQEEVCSLKSGAVSRDQRV